MKKHIFGLLGMGLLSAHWFLHAADNLDVLKSQDIFSLEYASGLEVSNDGQKVLFVRNFMDIQSDRKLSNIWSVDTKTKTMRPITTGDHVDYSPLLSPDQNKVAFISTRTGSPQIYIRWLDTGQLAKISNITTSPGNLSWSPDGEHIVFSMFVEKPQPSPVNLPGKPKGAKWAAPAKFIDDVYYRFDGGG